ncbi:hypothetical protein DRP53_09875, partial [candidate division WOR-3 bacterium]
MDKRLLLIILLFAYSLPAKFYPKRIQNRDRFTKADLEGLADDKMVAIHPDGCDLVRDQWNSPILFFTDPAAGRFEYLRYRVVGDADDTLRYSAFGGYGEADSQYKLPAEVMIHNLSDLYILDTDNNRIGRAIFNLPDFSVTALPPIATNVGLSHPQGFDVVETDQGLKIYVADTKNHRIVRLSADGSLEQTYGSFGSGVGQFYGPHDIARHGDFVYVVDTYNKRVVALLEKEDGTFEWWAEYSPSEPMSFLVSIACDANGNVFCVDKANCRVIKLTEGLEEFLWSEGTRGALWHQFLHPRSIAVSKRCDDVTIIDAYTKDTGIRFLGNKISILSASAEIEEFDATRSGGECPLTFKIDDVAGINFRITGPAELPPQVAEAYQCTVLITGTTFPSGTNHYLLSWDGRDQYGLPALPGTYQVTLLATDCYGHHDEYTVFGFKVKGTLVHGEISGRWTVDNDPYVVINLNEVGPGATLTIDPGVRVMFWQFWPGMGLRVRGTLSAIGTETDSIRFIPHIKEGDPAEPGMWGEIYLTAGSDNTILDHCQIAYGGEVGGMVSINFSSPRVKNSYLGYSKSSGVLISVPAFATQKTTPKDFFPAPEISGNLIVDNGDCGVRVEGNYSPRILNNTFSNNHSYGVYVCSETTVVVPEVRDNQFTGHQNTYVMHFYRGQPIIEGNSADGTNKKRGIAIGHITYTEDRAWDELIPWVVFDTIWVDTHATLTIKPGAVVKLEEDQRLLVKGSIIAQGTETDSIYFTSIYDDGPGGDVNGDGNATAPQPGDWYGIRFMEIREGEEGSEKAETRLERARKGNVATVLPKD